MKEILYLVMLKYVLVLACVVSFSQNVSAQKNIDSLRALVNKTTGIHKIDALNTLAYETGTLTTGESLTYSKEAYALSEKLNYDKGKALALLYMAYFKSNQGQLSEPRTLILQSVHLSHKIKEFEIEGYAYACLGQILRSEGKMDSVYFYSLKALQLLKSGKNLYYLSFLYNTLADYFQKEIQPDSQLFYAKKSWVVRQKLPDKNYLIFAGTRLADYYTLYQDFSMALAYLDSSQTTLKTDTLSGEAIATIWTKKAIVYSRLSNFKFATYFFNKAKQYYSTNLSPLELSDLLIEMTELYEDIGDYESSLKNGFEALSIVEKNNYSIEQTRALIRIAWSYYNLKQFKLSEKYNKEAITLAIKNKQSFELGTAYNLYGQISDSNEALVYYRKALAIRIRNKNISGQAEVYSNLGQFYFQHSRLDSAIYYHQLSLSLISKVHHTTGKAYALARIGQTYTALKNYPLASLFLDRAAHIADSIKSATIKLEVLKYKMFNSKSSKNWNQYVANSEAYNLLSDSLFKTSLANRISNLETQHEIEIRNAEIELKNTKIEAQSNELSFRKNQITFLIAAGILVILISVVIYLFYHRTRKLNFQIIEKNNDLAASQEEIQAQNEELVLLNEKISSQRDVIEKQRNDLDLKNDELTKTVKKRTKELVQYIQQLEQFTFISSHNLRAPAARILGLGNLLEMNGLDNSDFPIIFQSIVATTRELDRVITDLNMVLEIRRNGSIILSDISLSETIQTIKLSLFDQVSSNRALIVENFSAVDTIKSFRPYVESILLNLVSNAIKYRKPDLNPIINITSIDKKKYVCVKISDNGIGIDLNVHKDKIFTLYKRFHDHVEGKGLGLYLVKTQIVTLGGRIEIESTVNQGTTFYVYFKKEKGLV